jgi:SAM-dependent methyltransferase
MTENWFDGETAASYDDESDPMFAPALLDATSGFLAGLAGSGRALELAVGTGRVALPLAARGVPVSGIELSPDMLARLRAKPGGAAIDAVEGDLTTARVPGEFSLVYLVYNTITNLLTQDAQVAAFENAARHLASGGRFVIEVYVPILRLLAPGERFHVFADEPTYHAYDEYADAASQRQWSHHVQLREDGTYRRVSMPFRYVWPAELDLMARIAGLRLTDRWQDWARTPFTETSTAHVSVWEKP